MSEGQRTGPPPVGTAVWPPPACPRVLEDGRAGDAVWAAVLDLDHLKKFNGHNGHVMGDDVIRRLGGYLLTSGPEVVRSGGGEFTLLFADADEEQAVDTCERIRLWVESSLSPPQAADCGTRGCRGPTMLTVSIGIARASDPDSGHVRERALDAMYAAKLAGGNTVVVG